MIKKSIFNKIRRINQLYSVCFFSTRIPKLAVIGSGPAGMFTCNGILRRTQVCIDVFEYSPVPFGLVRYGVAPDHQEVKNVINTFDMMFEKNRDKLRLFCNVNVGKDVTFDELTDNYDAVLLAYGSYKARKLNIPGCNLKNVLSGSEFVGWYNGVPNSIAPKLDNIENVTIVGNGNVALDCARILSTASSGKLRSTDIPNERLTVLENAPIKNIDILGRRGPENVSFTIKELKEHFKVEDWDSKIEVDEEEKQKLAESLNNLDRKKKRLTEVLIKNIGLAEGPKKCRFLFHRVPQEILSNSNDAIGIVKVLNKKTNLIEENKCDLLIYSIGYETKVLNGVPQNEKKMIDMEDYCRVKMPKNCNSKVFATGWCAHGPKGVIVDTQQQSMIVAEEIAEDLKQINNKTNFKGVEPLLVERNVKFISWDDWKRIDQEEKQNGKQSGKIREKFTTFDRFFKFFR